MYKISKIQKGSMCHHITGNRLNRYNARYSFDLLLSRIKEFAEDHVIEKKATTNMAIGKEKEGVACHLENMDSLLVCIYLPDNIRDQIKLASGFANMAREYDLPGKIDFTDHNKTMMTAGAYLRVDFSTLHPAGIEEEYCITLASSYDRLGQQSLAHGMLSTARSLNKYSGIENYVIVDRFDSGDIRLTRRPLALRGITEGGGGCLWGIKKNSFDNFALNLFCKECEIHGFLTEGVDINTKGDLIKDYIENSYNGIPFSTEEWQLKKEA